MELDKTSPDSTSDPIYIPDGMLFGDTTVTSAYVSVTTVACTMYNVRMLYVYITCSVFVARASILTTTVVESRHYLS